MQKIKERFLILRYSTLKGTVAQGNSWHRAVGTGPTGKKSYGWGRGRRQPGLCRAVKGTGAQPLVEEARPCQRSPDARTQLTRLDVRTRVCLCGGLQPEGWNVGDSLSSTLPHQNPRPVRRPIPRL